MAATELPLNEARVRRCARPIRTGSGETAVLGLHGFMGYPGELAYPASRLADAGFTVSVPRMPGHGTCGEDFDNSTGDQWLRCAVDHYLELRSRYRDVHLMGHSMGGILSLILASRFPVKKMVLMAPAVQVAYPLGMSVPASWFVRKVLNKPAWKADPSIRFRDDRDPDDDEFLGGEYWTWSNFRRLADLHRLKVRSVRGMKKVNSSILTIMGQDDPTVPTGAAQLIRKRTSGEVRTVILEKNAHLIPYERDYKKTGDLTVDWLLRS